MIRVNCNKHGRVATDLCPERVTGSNFIIKIVMITEAMGKQPSRTLAVKVLEFYIDGFRRMTVGRTLWKVILIKLFIMFAVLKLFFFQDFLDARFTTDQQKADYVLEQITAPVQAQPALQQGGEL